ncbi:hypothetical protein diail_7697 [Diaporthe ilicicola]|nr:hypothetical protein diail_7697 [Diaporthe ilicicola]
MIKPDYGKPLVEVYAEAVRASIVEAQSPLFLQFVAWLIQVPEEAASYDSGSFLYRLIGRLWIPSHPRRLKQARPEVRAEPDWPSWVVRLNGIANADLGSCYNIISFSNQAPSSNYLRFETRDVSSPLVLSLRGYILGRVVFASQVFTLANLRDPRKLEQIIKLCVENTIGNSTDDLPYTFVSGTNHLNQNAEDDNAMETNYSHFISWLASNAPSYWSYTRINELFGYKSFVAPSDTAKRYWDGMKGLKTLARLHANGDESDVWIQAEFAQIQAAITHEHEHEAKGYCNLFTDRSSFRRLILMVALQASVQMTGVSAIQYVTPDIYKQVNIGTTDSLKYQAISNVLSVITQLCTILFIDQLGHRWSLVSGNAITGVCFIIVTAVIVSFPNASSSGQSALSWVFIVTNLFYQVSFSFTCGSLSWIIPAEVFDTKTRSKGISIGVMNSFACNTMIGQITAPAIANIGWRGFLIFVGCNFTNAIFFWAFMPGTKKLPLEEVYALFSSSSGFVAGSSKKRYQSELDARVNEVRRENGDPMGCH